MTTTKVPPAPAPQRPDQAEIDRLIGQIERLRADLQLSGCLTPSRRSW